MKNFISYDHYIHDLPTDKSITNTVNVHCLTSSWNPIPCCRKCSEDFSRDAQNVSLNPHLLYWTYTWNNSSFTSEENRILLSNANKLNKIHHTIIMDILFLNLPYEFMISRTVRSKKTKSGTLYYPYWISYCVGVCEEQGFNCKLVNCIRCSKVVETKNSTPKLFFYLLKNLIIFTSPKPNNPLFSYILSMAVISS